MNNSIIRFATKKDMRGVLVLIHELAEYEHASQEVTVTEEDLIRDGFTSNLFKCIVAEYEGKIVGMALYYPRYSTWKGKTIHLEDFVVTEDFRRFGLGKRLFDEVVLEAQKFGAKRLEWAVLNWNDPAIDFYTKIGVEYEKDWYLVKLREDQLNEYAFTTKHALFE